MEDEKVSMCELLGVQIGDLERVKAITKHGLDREEKLLKMIDSPDLLGLPSRNQVRVQCLKRIVEQKDYLILYLELEIDRLKKDLREWNEGIEVKEEETQT